MELIADLELRQQPPRSFAWYVLTFQGPRAVQAVCWVPQYLHVMKKLARTDDPIGSTGAEEKLQLQNWVISEHSEEHAAAEGRDTLRAHRRFILMSRVTCTTSSHNRRVSGSPSSAAGASQRMASITAVALRMRGPSSGMCQCTPHTLSSGSPWRSSQGMFAAMIVHGMSNHVFTSIIADNTGSIAWSSGNLLPA